MRPAIASSCFTTSLAENVFTASANCTRSVRSIRKSASPRDTNRPAADSQYVRAMDWIVERGVENIPEGVSFDQACFVEPVNTCLKGVKQIDPQPGRCGGGSGSGPHRPDLHHDGGAHRREDRGHRYACPARRALAQKFGAMEAFDPRDDAFEKAVRAMTDGRGADVVIVAASAKGIVEQAVRCYPSRRTNSAVCANLASGAHRGFRRRHLYGGADFMRVLQRFGGHPEGIGRSGIQRRSAGGRTYLPPVSIKPYS